MIALGLVILGWIGISLWMAHSEVKHTDSEFSLKSNFIYNMFMGVLPSLIIFGLFSLMFAMFETTTQESVTTDLTAVGTSSELTGSFFLASGSIGEEQVYKYIETDNKGGSRMKTVDVRNVVVYEDATADTAHMIRTYDIVGESNVLSYMSDRQENYEVEFHIPPGSIKNVFDIDVTEE